MPTARELLEQADALMRRNRSAVMDDIPVLTDSVSDYPGARVVRGRVPPPHELPQSSVSTDPIPTPERAPVAAPTNDVVVEEGEPSDWLQLGAGDPSVIGDAPDSIAIVPDLPLAQPPPPLETEEIEMAVPDEVEEAFDEELAGRPEPESELSAATEPPPAARDAPPSAAAIAAALEHIDPPVPDLGLLDDRTITSDMDVTEADLAPPAEEDELVAESSGWSEDDGALDLAAVETSGEGAPEPERAPESASLPPEPMETAASLAAAAAAEDARWSSMAEEIRMQVLQRIDLFTDTGLREQLGARLQPIVDRASADLVATINQHVGELLRAYVAEAIEREIESWRQQK